MRWIIELLSWRHWGIIRYNSLWQNAAAVFYLALTHQLYSWDFIARMVLFVLFSMLSTSYGYLVNDLADRELDRRHGKPNVFAGVGGIQPLAVVGVTAVGAALASFPFLHRPWFALLWGAWFCLATFYSLPPLRLKERGLSGLAAAILAQQTLPTLLIFASFGHPVSWGALAFAVYATARGVSSDVGHQMRDWVHDARTETPTFAVRRGYRAICRLYAACQELDKLLLGTVMVVLMVDLPSVSLPGLGLQAGPAWPLVAFYLVLYTLTAGQAWKGLQQSTLPDPYDQTPQGPERNVIHFIHHSFPSVVIPLYLAGWMTLFYHPNGVFVLALILLYRLYSPRRWAAAWPLRTLWIQVHQSSAPEQKLSLGELARMEQYMPQSPDSFDIAIVGGGLAGLSAAVAIGANSEARVVLIDKDVGHNNPTPLTFSDVVQRFGLEDSVMNRYRGFSLHSSLGNQSLHYYSDFPLVSLNYRWACYILLTRAQQSLGFAWQRGYATGLAKDREGWIISLNGSQRIRTLLLIDASGRAHFAARYLYLDRPRMYSHCYGQIFSRCQITDSELAEGICLFLGGSERFGNGGGWCYPLGASRISFGFASVTDSLQYPLRLVRQRYQRALQEFAPYAYILARGEPGPVERGSIPLGPVRRFVYDGLMLVGDAAGQATPWACMGVEPALVNGQICGRVAAQAFKQGDFRVRVLREYETIWAQANRRSYRQGTMLAPLQWTQSEEVWDKITASHSRLAPEETLAYLRYNEPIHSLPVLGWSMVYDRLGRIRRGARDWVRQHLRTWGLRSEARGA